MGKVKRLGGMSVLALCLFMFQLAVTQGKVASYLLISKPFLEDNFIASLEST